MGIIPHVRFTLQSGTLPLTSWEVSHYGSEMTVQSELLKEIETFLATRRSMAETTFGRLAVNDGKFVRRLRDGCNTTLSTVDRVKRFIASHHHVEAPSSRATPQSKPKRTARASSSDTPQSSAEKAA